jgi:epoxyqueuosine reductase QueG
VDTSNRIGVNVRLEEEDRRRQPRDEDEFQVKALGLTGAYVQSAVEVVAANGATLFAEVEERSVTRAASIGIYGRNQSIVSGSETPASSPRQNEKA